MPRAGWWISALVALLAILLALPAGAATAKRARLSVEGLRGVPATVQPGERLRVRGRVVSGRRGARRVVLTARLRTLNGADAKIGRKTIRRRLIRDEIRPFRLKARVPESGLDAGKYRLIVCARANRATGGRCGKRRTRLAATYVTPAPAATATATATYTLPAARFGALFGGLASPD